LCKPPVVIKKLLSAQNWEEVETTRISQENHWREICIPIDEVLQVSHDEGSILLVMPFLGIGGFPVNVRRMCFGNARIRLA